MNKKVIFIGGTSYSGSTMIDMILANDPNGYSLGEIHALFRPFRRHHFDEIKRVKLIDIWENIISDREDNLYLNLFKYLNNISFFVDSSKTVFWIKKQCDILKLNNILFKNVLIYKEPEDLANSFLKRGMYKNWKRTYINYHRLYFSLISDFITVSYKDLVTDDATLISLCKYLEIPYFENKNAFWEKEHHTFFGNRRARIHTSNLTVTEDEVFKTYNKKEDIRKIYYHPVTNNKVVQETKTIINKDHYLRKIIRNLRDNNINNNSYKLKKVSIANEIKFNRFNIQLRNLKYKYSSLFIKNWI